ncbi:sulfate/molybdate ABC transporter ATP-binding protein [Leucobacter sp. Z1108]
MNPGDSFQAEITLSRGSFSLSAALEAPPGKTVGIIGPNGAGKSSLLKAIAGDITIRSGSVRIGERILSQAGERIRSQHLPRAQRKLGYLDQRARLFPHLSAQENIAFGPRAAGVSRRHAFALADQWLERVGLPGRGAARAHELSGGQQQRVAIARTLAAKPAAVLLDEPFAALDASTAGSIRGLIAAELSRLQIPALLVTHNAVDLLELAQEVCVLEHGRITQQGPVHEILSTPRTDFAARFSGRVLIRGSASARGTLQLARAPLPELRGVGDLPCPSGDAVASFDPRDVRVSPQGDRQAEGSIQSWTDDVGELTVTGSGVRVTGRNWTGSVAEVPLSRAHTFGLSPGQTLIFELPPHAVSFAPGTEAR